MLLCIYFTHKTLKIILQSGVAWIPDSSADLSVLWCFSPIQCLYPVWQYSFNSANYCFCTQKIKHITLPQSENYLDQISLPPISLYDMKKLLKIFTYISNGVDTDSGFGSCHESTDISDRKVFNPTLQLSVCWTSWTSQASQGWSEVESSLLWIEPVNPK